MAGWGTDRGLPPNLPNDPHLDKEVKMDDMTVEKTETGVRYAPGARHIRLEDLPEPIPGEFNKEKFAELLRVMKNDRSVREFALETDLSDSFISKAINGYIDKSPSRRTLLKLLCAGTCDLVNRRELVLAAGYPADKLDWDNLIWENDEEKQKFSTAESIARYYGGNHFLACGRLMKVLAEHGVTGDMSSYFYRENGYFEIKDETTGQVYVGINVYNSADEEKESAVWSMVFSLALTFNKVAMSEGAKDKVVIIMTNDERIFDGCHGIGFNEGPKATVVVLTDSFQGFRKEDVLSGSSPISLLD